MASSARDRVVLITGASRGIGLGLVNTFLQRSDGRRKTIVIATCRNPSTSHDLQSLSTIPSNNNTELHILPLDITDLTSHQSLLQSLQEKKIEYIDILIANAGVATKDHPHNPFFECSLEDIHHTMQTNLIGTMLTLQSYSSLVEISQEKVCMVISSRLGSITQAEGMGGYTAYRASKAALNMLTMTYAEDSRVKEHGVKVLAVHPGWVQTEMGGANGRRAPVTVEKSSRGIFKLANEASEVDRSTHEKKAEKKLTHVQKRVLKEACVFIGYDGEDLPW